MGKKKKKQKNQRARNAYFKAQKREQNKLKQRLGVLSEVELLVMLNRQSDNQSLHSDDRAKLYEIQKKEIEGLLRDERLKPTRVIARDTFVVSQIREVDLEAEYLYPSKKVSMRKLEKYEELEDRYYDLLRLALDEYDEYDDKRIIGLQEYFDENLYVEEVEGQIVAFKNEFPGQDINEYMQSFFEDIAREEYIKNARELTQSLFDQVLSEKIDSRSAYSEMCQIGISFDFIGIDTTYTGRWCVVDKYYNDFHKQQLTARERWIVELRGTIDGKKFSLYFPYSATWLNTENLPVERIDSLQLCPREKELLDYPLEALARKLGYKKKFPLRLDPDYGSDYGSYPEFSPWKRRR